jgi:hypothetical protein
VYYSVATVGVGGESAKSLEKGVVL